LDLGCMYSRVLCLDLVVLLIQKQYHQYDNQYGKRKYHLSFMLIYTDWEIQPVPWHIDGFILF